MSGPTDVREQQKLTPPKVSLLTAADLVSEDDERWYSGFEVDPDGCGAGGLYDLCNNDGPKTYDSSPEVLGYKPYIIYGSDRCSTWGYSKHDFYGRAQRRLLANESYWLEHELWTGSMGGNPFLTDEDTVTVVTEAPTLIQEALERIEDGLANCSHGGRFMIHVRPHHLVALATNNTVRREGNLWLTPMDNIVVPGRGYTGTAPGSDPDDEPTDPVDWIYATTVVQVRRGPVILLPTPDENGKPPAAAIARDTNDIFILAERVAVASFDSSCCHLGAEVTRTVTVEAEGG